MHSHKQRPEEKKANFTLCVINTFHSTKINESKPSSPALSHSSSALPLLPSTAAAQLFTVLPLVPSESSGDHNAARCVEFLSLPQPHKLTTTECSSVCMSLYVPNIDLTVPPAPQRVFRRTISRYTSHRIEPRPRARVAEGT